MFTSRAYSAIGNTLSPTSPTMPMYPRGPHHQFHPHPPVQGALSPPTSQGGEYGGYTPSKYADLVAAAHAAVAALPSPSHSGTPPQLSRTNAILSELDAAMSRLSGLRSARQTLESGRGMSFPAPAVPLSPSPSQTRQYFPPGSPLMSASRIPSHQTPMMPSELGSTPSPPSYNHSRLSDRVLSLDNIQTSLFNSVQRLHVASQGLHATASAAGGSGGGGGGAGTPMWRESGVSSSPPPPSFHHSPLRTSGVERGMGGGGGGVGGSGGSPFSGSGRLSPLQSTQLHDAHATQRSSEALYHAASAWRGGLPPPQSPDTPHFVPTRSPTLVSHSIHSMGGEQEEEEEGEEGKGYHRGGGGGDAFMASLCAAAGLERHQEGALLARVEELSRASVAASGLSAFAGEVCDTLAVKVLGLGEVRRGGGVHYAPLRKLGSGRGGGGGEEGEGEGGAGVGDLTGPAFVGLSQAQVILNAALEELQALRVLFAATQREGQ